MEVLGSSSEEAADVEEFKPPQVGLADLFEPPHLPTVWPPPTPSCARLVQGRYNCQEEPSSVVPPVSGQPSKAHSPHRQEEPEQILPLVKISPWAQLSVVKESDFS